MSENLLDLSNDGYSSSDQTHPPPRRPQSSKPFTEPPPPLSLPPNDRITLQVGEEHFHTLESTLTSQSTYFTTLLSTPTTRQSALLPDGSYFIDADPSLFVHILRYLRRPTAGPPIFYSLPTGFNHALYHALRTEAAHFGIAPLTRWIDAKAYLATISVEYKVEALKAGADQMIVGVASGDTQRRYEPSWMRERVACCPRGIAVHDDVTNPANCGKACDTARAEGAEGFVEREFINTFIVEKRTVWMGGEGAGAGAGWGNGAVVEEARFSG